MRHAADLVVSVAAAWIAARHAPRSDSRAASEQTVVSPECESAPVRSETVKPDIEDYLD